MGFMKCCRLTLIWLCRQVTKGKLQPDEDVEVMIETAVKLLLGSGTAMTRWLAQPQPSALGRSASSVGTAADSNFKAMKLVSVSHADGKLRLSRVSQQELVLVQGPPVSLSLWTVFIFPIYKALTLCAAWLMDAPISKGR